MVTESEKPWEAIVSDILTLMRTACDSSTLPIIVDDGAIAQQNGVLRPEFELLYHSISADRNIDAMFVLSRRVYGSGNATLPSIRVQELDHSSTQSLIRIAGRDMGLAFERSDLGSIATYSRGYPPAVKFVLDEARVRGVPQVVANQRALVNFSAELFLRQLKDEASLTQNMSLILQLLSSL